MAIAEDVLPLVITIAMQRVETDELMESMAGTQQCVDSFTKEQRNLRG